MPTPTQVNRQSRDKMNWPERLEGFCPRPVRVHGASKQTSTDHQKSPDEGSPQRKKFTHALAGSPSRRLLFLETIQIVLFEQVAPCIDERPRAQASICDVRVKTL